LASNTIKRKKNNSINGNTDDQACLFDPECLNNKFNDLREILHQMIHNQVEINNALKNANIKTEEINLEIKQLTLWHLIKRVFRILK